MGKRKFNYYAVRRGKVPGVYTSWEECQKQLKGFKGNCYKGFFTQEEAENFLIDKQPKFCEAVAYTSGGYNIYTDHYGWCGILVFQDKKYTVKGTSNDERVKSWSFAGKVKAVEETINKAISLGIKSLKIFQDLHLLVNLALKLNRPKLDSSREFVKFIDSKSKLIDLEFEYMSKNEKNPFMSESYNTMCDILNIN